MTLMKKRSYLKAQSSKNSSSISRFAFNQHQICMKRFY